MTGSNAVVRSAKIINLIAAGLMCVAGILLMALGSMESVLAQRIMLGILFGLTGFARIFGYFSNDLYRLAFQFDLAFGVFCELLTLLLVLSPEQNYAVLHMLLVTYVLFDGLLKLQMSFDSRKFGMKSWGIMLATSLVLCAAATFAAAAIQSEILPPVFTVGLALCLDGSENCWITAIAVRIRAKKKHFFHRFGLPEE